MKLKVGDHVRLKKNCYGYMSGDIGEVVRVDGDGDVEVFVTNRRSTSDLAPNVFICAGSVEFVNRREDIKFKVGDRVHYRIGEGYGDETIYRIDHRGFIQGRYSNGAISVACVNPKYYTLIKGENVKFQVGDKVIGNEKANDHYTVTRKGWTGTVAKVRNGRIDVGDYVDLDETCFDLLKPANHLESRIHALQNIGQEAFEIMAEIGGEYDINIPTSFQQPQCVAILNKSKQKLGVCVGSYIDSPVLASFNCHNPCQVGDAYKKALLFIAEREGKLGPKVGDSVTTEIQGKKYSVKILQEVC